MRLLWELTSLLLHVIYVVHLHIILTIQDFVSFVVIIYLTTVWCKNSPLMLNKPWHPNTRYLNTSQQPPRQTNRHLRKSLKTEARQIEVEINPFPSMFWYFSCFLISHESSSRLSSFGVEPSRQDSGRWHLHTKINRAKWTSEEKPYT